jgi:hypothetical protein
MMNWFLRSLVRTSWAVGLSLQDRRTRYLESRYWICERIAADDPVSEEGKGEIQLTSEDYLQGVISMVNELVCLYPRLR